MICLGTTWYVEVAVNMTEPCISYSMDNNTVQTVNVAYCYLQSISFLNVMHTMILLHAVCNVRCRKQ